MRLAGIAESSHAYWSKMMMLSVSNRLVSQTIVKTIGITADGEMIGGLFQDAETRWSDAEGQPLPESTDRNVRHAKACLAFLTLGAECVIPHPMKTLTVQNFLSDARIELSADDERGWHRHRRESGGRMSSDFRVHTELRSPTDAELAALVVHCCQSHRQQLIDDGVLDDDDRRLISAEQIAQLLENDLGDLSSRDACMTAAFDKFCRCMRAEQAGCILVPHLRNDSIHRHAEAATTRRGARGIAPTLPAELQPMCEVLAHGGPLSFSEPAFLSVEKATGRCECPDSIWHGVLSATLRGQGDDTRGGCKHDQLSRLCQEAHQNDEAAVIVHKRCASFLCQFIGDREASRPANQRCKPLYTAGKQQDVDALMAALKVHPSLPPTGKGIAMSHTEPAAEATQSDGEEADEAELCEAAVEALQSLRRRICRFSASELALNGFGAAFTENSVAGGGAGLVVAAWLSVHGPPVLSGEVIEPGDIVLAVNGADASELLSAGGMLDVPQGDPVTLEFVRRERHISVPYLGGRPAATKPKYGRSASRKGKCKAWISRVREDELLGGSPAQAKRKPQRSRAREHAGRSVDDPSADEQMEAVLREAAEVGGGEEDITRIAEELEGRLLAHRELSAEDREARDAELLETVYFK